MHPLVVASGAFVAYLVAYYTYGRWLGRRVFELSAANVCPSEALRDDRDFVPTRSSVVFGHHFVSIAGTGPIVGPALAVFWGWLPALLWVLLGSIFIGAVHDFGALVVSLRNRGQTIGEIAARVLNPRVRILLLLVLFLALMIVLAVFGLVIATIFAAYPVSVFAIWIEVPIAIAVGYLVYRRGGNVTALSIIAVVLMYASVYVGAYHLPLDIVKNPWLALGGTGAAAESAGLSPYANAVVAWTLILFVYCFFASVMPVWTLLQPRDFINSHQLFVALALLCAGLVMASFLGSLHFVTAPVTRPPADAPPLIPFLFITVACGAVSGFHCLVSSGTTSKQLRSERAARLVGYGAMLLEGGLAVVVILACTAAIGMGVWDLGTGRAVALVDADGGALTGAAAWHHLYGQYTWRELRFANQLAAFIEGGANLLHTLGIPIQYAIGLIAVLIASFAATTLDTATRLQRYVVAELGTAVGVPVLANRYVATTVAVVTAGAIALISGPAGPGSGGMILWPIFGATNQLLAGLAFLVIAFYLLRHRKPVWFLVVPTILMLVIPGWALSYEVVGWWADRNYLLVALALAVQLMQVWIVVEGLYLLPRVRGVLPDPLPPRHTLPHTVAAPAAGE
ncbi:MAG: carbon starvation protein A [Phycisphaerales bacterium]|nr:carbon starvation protein A [Phycisphaerales bacterium]